MSVRFVVAVFFPSAVFVPAIKNVFHSEQLKCSMRRFKMLPEEIWDSFQLYLGVVIIRLVVLLRRAQPSNA